MASVSEHFTTAEFLCRCGDPQCNAPTSPDATLIAALEALRARLERSIEVTSGIRCRAHNARVGGSYGSMHLLGKAADIRVDGYTGRELADVARRIPAFTGIGTYPDRIHVDIRPGVTRVEWTGDR